MKKIILFMTLISLVAVMTVACSSMPIGKGTLKDRTDSLSYVLGLQVGKNLDPEMVKLNYNKFVKGMQDAADTSKILLKEEQINNLMMTFQAEMSLKYQQKRLKEAEQNKKMQNEFFAKNKNNPGVVSTPEGLQYKIITEGKGPKANSNSDITAKFTGKTLDGKKVFSSEDLPPDFKFKPDQFIPGWSVALKMMPKGSKWQLFVPDSLAFGAEGNPQLKIGPNQGLIFDFELIDIN